MNHNLGNTIPEESILQLAQRVLDFYPASKSITTEEAMQMAQMALMTGANPLGEEPEIKIYEEGGKRVIMLSVTYYERRAREAGGVMYYPEARHMTAQERSGYLVDDGDLAIICLGIPVSRVRELRQMEFGINMILGNGRDDTGMLQVGWGIVSSKEMSSTRQPEIGGTWRKTAERRAVKHLLKKLFGLPDPQLHLQGEAVSAAGAASLRQDKSHHNDKADIEDLIDELYPA